MANDQSLDDSKLNHPATQDNLNSPSARLMQDYLNSPSARLMQDYLNSPSARLMQDYLNSPSMRLAQERLAGATFITTDHALARYLAGASHSLRFSPELDRFRVTDQALTQAMTSSRGAWLDLKDIPHSIDAFTTLSAFGNALQSASPFENGISSALRSGLGNWHYPLSATDDLLLDASARRDYYALQGLNLKLTSFPATSYSAILTSANLSPALNNHDAASHDQSQRAEEDEASLEIGAQVFQILRPFEVEFRNFIAVAMESRFGLQWTKQRISDDVRMRWEKRRAHAVRDGEIERPLHMYADLFDYAEIIIRNDNWSDLFAAIFVDRNEVQVSFRRLNAVRRPLVHAREITNEDLLFVNVEVIRLRKSVQRAHKLE